MTRWKVSAASVKGLSSASDWMLWKVQTRCTMPKKVVNALEGAAGVQCVIVGRCVSRRQVPRGTLIYEI